MCLTCCESALIEDWQIMPMINEYRAGAVASGAMDGVAPESSQEGSLREEQHLHGTAYHISLNALCFIALRSTLIKVLPNQLDHCAEYFQSTYGTSLKTHSWHRF